MRAMAATYAALRRMRKSVAKKKPGKTWAFETQKIRIRADLLEKEAKVLSRLHAMAVERELPEQVEKLEQLKRDLDARHSGGRRAHRADEVRH